MARKQRWSVFSSFCFGILGASLVWFYVPFFRNLAPSPGVEELAMWPLPAEVSKKGGSLKEMANRQATGSRFQMVTDGKEVFLADLKEGRVWRYYRSTRNSKEEEGFLALSMFYEGKPFASASEVEDRAMPKEREQKTP